jgi:hypothetical protein
MRNPLLILPKPNDALVQLDREHVKATVAAAIQGIDIPFPASLPSPTPTDEFKQWIEEFVADVVEGL